MVAAGIALLLGPLQFWRSLRDRAPRVHRAVGKTYLVAVLVGGVAATALAPVNSAGFVGMFGFGTLGILWMWTAWRGYRAIRTGDVRGHQAWMIRNFALTYAAVMLRLWLGVLMGVQVPGIDSAADAEAAFANAYAAVPFLCWLPNLVVAELLVRASARAGLPAACGSSRPRTVSAGRVAVDAVRLSAPGRSARGSTEVRSVGKVHDAIDGRLRAFVEAQPMFFVATAPERPGRARERVAQGHRGVVRGAGRAHGGLPRPHGQRRRDHRAPARRRPDHPDVLRVPGSAQHRPAVRPRPLRHALRRRVRRAGRAVPRDARRPRGDRRRRGPGLRLVRVRRPAP